MRALVYHGPKDVQIDNVPEPVIQKPTDIILKVSATAICGTDLHMYRGKMPEIKEGDILGHEFMGFVEEVGSAITHVQSGDRVVISAILACGTCYFCTLEMYAACENSYEENRGLVNPKKVKPPAAIFGYDGVPGGQAEWVRVPFANIGAFKVPDNLSDEKVLFLSDILPTGYQAAVNAGIKEGSNVAIFGAGPVGLMAAACARMLGADNIYMIDHHDYRLDFAREAYDVIPINFDKIEHPAQAIIDDTGRYGVDAAIDAVGFEAKGSKFDSTMAALKLETSSGSALRQCIASVRRGGVISVAGVYSGYIQAFLFGEAFDKGVTFKMGGTHMQKYIPELLQLIEEGSLNPDIIITHSLPLEKAKHAYKIFDEKKQACRKIILIP